MEKPQNLVTCNGTYTKICIYLSYLLPEFGHASQPPLEVTYIHTLDAKAITTSLGNRGTGDI
jgi:hypothetical protein